MEAIPADQGAVSVAATKAASPLCGAASYRYAVNPLLTSVVRKNCTLGSVGAGGWSPLLATRWRSVMVVPAATIEPNS